jgi:hypothetical protein
VNGGLLIEARDKVGCVAVDQCRASTPSNHAALGSSKQSALQPTAKLFLEFPISAYRPLTNEW